MGTTWTKMLVVDDSKVYLGVVTTLLGPYCATVLTARSVEEAKRSVEANPDLDAVLCDVGLGADSGFDLLEWVGSRADLTFPVVMVTATPSEEIVSRAQELGALETLSKPTSLRRILRALRSADPGGFARSRPRFRCAGKAYLVEPGSEPSASMAWDIYNISPEGAFLESKGPISIGAEFDLELHLGGGKAAVRAQVVRVQDPSWLNIGGVGVRFIEIDDDADAVLTRTLSLGNSEPD